MRYFSRKILHWLTAKTAYEIHSPFLYEVYCNVLTARLGRSKRLLLGLKAFDKRNALLYKLVNYFFITSLDFNIAREESAQRMLYLVDNGVKISNDKSLPNDAIRMTLSDGSHILLLHKPHSADHHKQKLYSIAQQQHYKLVVDLFDEVMMFDRPQLSQQYIKLKW